MAVSAPLRPLGTAELLDTAVRAVRRNAAAAASIAAPFAVLRTAADATFRYSTIRSASVSASYVLLLAEVAVSCVVGTVLAGVLAPLVAAHVLGAPVTATECLRRARRATPALALLAIVVAVAQTVGLLLLGVGGVWLWGVWAVAAPALVLERVGMRAALGRSVTLVRTQFWRVWGIRALRWVVTTVLGLLVSAPFTALAAYLSDSNPFRTDGIHDPGLFVAVTAVGALLALVVVTPISAAVDTLLYLDLRTRREGMDLVLALARRRPDRPAVTA